MTSILDGLTPELRDQLADAVRQLMARKRRSRAAARRIRQLLIDAWKGRCAGCYRKHQAVLQVHHADPVAEFGGDDPAHMFPLCPNCHAYVHALRKARPTPPVREALEREILHVHEGDDDALHNLIRIADTKSTREVMTELVAARAAEGDQA